MCGIFFCHDLNLNIKKALESLKLLEKRGPDYTHYDILNNTFLGQTVLSIVGNYSKNNFYDDNNNIILFNGEIYNYKEIENIDSDTKVLFNMFNKYDFKTLINKLDGMYAFVYFNSKKNNIYVGRDLQGEKGLYYYKDDNKIIFSSELGPILNYLGEKEIDVNILKRYFFTRHLIAFKNTIYKNIYLLEQGENLVIDLNTNKIINEFKIDIGDFVSKELLEKYKAIDNDKLEKILDILLEKNINQMLPKTRFSSVVSGGIDSSLISTYIKNSDLLVNVNCIGKDLISSNLIKFKKYYNKDILQINISKEEYINEVISCQNILKTPINTHSAVTYSLLCKKLKQNKIKVLITGEGADELFGGYSCYLKNKINTDCSPSNYSKYINNNLNYNDDKLKILLSNKFNYYKNLYKNLGDNDYYYQAQLLTDFYFMVCGVSNRCTDIIGGLHGIEMRSVFYRKDILKFIINCPLKAKLNFKTNTTKILLKELFSKKLDKNLIFEKQGFCGFPNDCKILINNYNFVKKYLNFNLNNSNRDLEWKFINTEIFYKLTI